MAVLGVQLVVTLFTATLMHRLAPHCSFARWLLCNGSLFRYIHPSEEELRALAGKPRPRGRKERWANSLHDEKPLSVPRDAHFQLETCPLTAVDALGLASMTQHLEPVLKKQDWDWTLPVIKLSIRLGLAVLGSLLGAFLIFPGLRLAQTHQDALTLSADRPLLQLLLHTSFLSPLCTLWLWTKPVARDFLYQAPMRNMTFSVPSEEVFDSLRLWVLVVLCLLRLVVTRPHLQAYLCLAKARVEQLRKEAGRIEAREVQQRVVRVYCYVTVVSLQYLTPLILTLHCTLLLKTLGGYSWALSPTPHPLAPSQPSETLISVDPADEAQQTAAQVAGILGGLLTPLFLRGVLAYIIWWTAACQLLSSLFGLYFHQHLTAS
ncbi:transmembrane protein 161A isoform X6 [Rattus norvegicus]|uniref:transmembrane protein 161A isoform X6 n=1 Tax=Rattus norvegicus TaxID=10116 RepID=UPI0003D0E012|nr:transmembrane protein 161A isoform X5 [Rattus norvegicus]|eukprot:XP_006252976.1 PREDICTED: transmembrane protein 161A isoform X3 [Rattus norvegicus]